MIPKIKNVKALEDYKLHIVFDDGLAVLYNMKEDIEQIPDFRALVSERGLFESFQIDSSRTCLTWSDRIDLPSDTLLEYGTPIK